MSIYSIHSLKSTCLFISFSSPPDYGERQEANEITPCALGSIRTEILMWNSEVSQRLPCLSSVFMVTVRVSSEYLYFFDADYERHRNMIGVGRLYDSSRNVDLLTSFLEYFMLQVLCFRCEWFFLTLISMCEHSFCLLKLMKLLCFYG